MGVSPLPHCPLCLPLRGVVPYKGLCIAYDSKRHTAEYVGNIAGVLCWKLVYQYFVYCFIRKNYCYMYVGIGWKQLKAHGKYSRANKGIVIGILAVLKLGMVLLANIPPHTTFLLTATLLLLCTT